MTLKEAYKQACSLLRYESTADLQWSDYAIGNFADRNVNAEAAALPALAIGMAYKTEKLPDPPYLPERRIKEKLNRGYTVKYKITKTEKIMNPIPELEALRAKRLKSSGK